MEWEKGSPASISCIYSTKHNSTIIQLVQSKFDIYIVFVPFCMHAPFCWHSINEEWVGAPLIHFNGTSWWPLLWFHYTYIVSTLSCYYEMKEDDACSCVLHSFMGSLRSWGSTSLCWTVYSCIRIPQVIKCAYTKAEITLFIILDWCPHIPIHALITIIKVIYILQYTHWQIQKVVYWVL